MKSSSKDFTGQRTTKIKVRGRRKTRGFVRGAIWLALAAVLGFGATYKVAVVEGPSMLPTLHTDQRILLTRIPWAFGGIRDDDVVVIWDHQHKTHMVKRVYRTAGEVVEARYSPPDVPGDYLVPPDSVFVLGDNLGASEDSRSYGAVPLSDVVGKAVLFGR